MSLNRALPKVDIKFKGLCDYEGLWRLIRNWMVQQGYTFQERVRKHKVPNPSGAEDEFEWYGTRIVNTYVQFRIEMYAHTWDVQDVDIVREGKKVRMQQARIQLELKGSVILDYNSNFEKTKFLMAVRDFLNRYVWYKKITGGWEDELYYRIYKLHRNIKEYLGMETTTDS